MAGGSCSHLNYEELTSLGSFYTPRRIVQVVYELLAEIMRDGESVDVLLEPSCGYGAFFNTEFGTENTRYIGADIDSDAITMAKENSPKNEFFWKMLYLMSAK
ncbi:MAG: N-6 DNA methylase [Candidatus Ancillula trichonymphae]|jgi:type I restriction-modification system DNA methylase subunit|nr:N-6 DNA methylase [Candidatus Ancillula trichonymphae]